MAAASSDAVRDALLRVKALSADRAVPRSSRAAELLESLKLTNPKVGSALSSALTSDRVVSLNKPAVILKLGALYVQCGFAGEPTPRYTIRMDYAVIRSNVKAVLRDLLHNIFYERLLANPKERRVVISEALVEVDFIRHELHRTLLEDFGVVSVSPIPGPALALLPIGISSGLMVDLGYSELRILPVYCGLPIISAFRAIPLGGRSILCKLRKLLDSSSTVISSTGRTPASECDDLDIVLGDEVLEDIVVRACLIGKVMDRTENCEKVAYKLLDGRILMIDGKTRQGALEQIFDGGDDDSNTLASSILDSVVASPIDARAELLSRIIIYGGLAHAKGLNVRLIQELNTLLQGNERPEYHSLKRLKAMIVQFPCESIKAQCLEWIGASLFASFDTLNVYNITRDNHSSTDKTDWRQLWSGL